MGIFEKNKKSKESVEEPNKSITFDLGKVDSFTLLVGSQFNSFVGELSMNNSGLLNEVEQEAFNVFWKIACIDIDGMGNNIWNLRKGTFEAFNKDGVVLGFEKKDATVKNIYGSDEGRANFFYLSNDGNFIIVQSDRNKKAFLVYVSENITPRLLGALRAAEANALDIELEENISNNRLGIPDDVPIPSSIADTKPEMEEDVVIDLINHGGRGR